MMNSLHSILPTVDWITLKHNFIMTKTRENHQIDDTYE